MKRMKETFGKNGKNKKKRCDQKEVRKKGVHTRTAQRKKKKGARNARKKGKLERSANVKMKERSVKRSSEKSEKGKEECRRPKKDRRAEGHQRNTLVRKEKVNPNT